MRRCLLCGGVIFVLLAVGVCLGVPVPAFAQESPGRQEEDPEKPAVSAPMLNPVMKINRLDDNAKTYSFELRDAHIKDIFRVLAYDYKLNLLVDNEVDGKMTATMTNVSLEQFLEEVAESLNLAIEKKGNFIMVRPNLITKIFVLKHIEAQNVLSFGENAQTAGKGHIIYDLLSKKGKIFLGRQPNSIMVIDYPPYIAKIENYLNEIDRKMSTQIFKLKYLKAADIMGKVTESDQSQTSTYNSNSTSASETAETSSESGANSSGGS